MVSEPKQSENQRKWRGCAKMEYPLTKWKSRCVLGALCIAMMVPAQTMSGAAASAPGISSPAGEKSSSTAPASEPPVLAFTLTTPGIA